MFQVISDIDLITKELIINFKGGYYKVSLNLYTDVLNIKEIMFICFTIDKDKGVYKNKVLEEYETEYKQINTLLKEYFFKGGKK